MATVNRQDVLTRLGAAAIDIVIGALRHADHGGTFKGLFTLNVDGSPKPVLLIGAAHGTHEDGQVIAILNPDEELSARVHAGVSYTGGLLKEIVAGKCDAMVHLWIEAYRKDPGSIIDTYQPRTDAVAAKFEVR
ncbi:hypothetical protein [Burkholderia sp. Tr-20390]|uniref:hypothetical protein n=1 Tax=Burkholderia sp. Tr-20390 TaxID=2703904 RepID=UPI001981ED43|nr:hypothetical protein [Burkholderia sp. Tr-20390]MBN3729485.1 hypothetical protein [Burkholderia sp. Tr-20390]